MIRISTVETSVNSYSMSSDSTLIAVATGMVVKIIQMKNMITLQEFTFDDNISIVRFSQDSKKILAINKSKNRLWAKAVYDPAFKAEIEDLELKIMNAVWVPDSYQILTFSNWGIKATIYNLAEDKQMILKSPKSYDKAFSFSNNKKFLAIAEKRNAKDYIGIYYCQNWQLMNYFEVNTIDLADLCWSHDDSFLALWDSGYYFKWQVYLPTKQLIFEEEDNKLLGVKEFCLSPNGDYIAITTFDDIVVLYNSVSWIKIIEFDPNTVEYNENTKYYKEEVDTDSQEQKLMEKQQPKIFERVDKIKPKTINLEKSSAKKSFLAWSQFSEYLAFKLSTYPTTVFVFEISSLSIDTLISTKTLVKDLNFKGNLLHFAWGGPNFGIWEPTNLGVVNPFFGSKLFKCSKLEWSQDAKQMALRSKNELCLYYPNESLHNHLKPIPGMHLRGNFSLKESTIASTKRIINNEKVESRREFVEIKSKEGFLPQQHSYGMTKSNLENSPSYQINIEESFGSKSKYDPNTSRDDLLPVTELKSDMYIENLDNYSSGYTEPRNNDYISPRNEHPRPLTKYNISTEDLLKEYDNRRQVSASEFNVDEKVPLQYSQDDGEYRSEDRQTFNHGTFGGGTTYHDSLNPHQTRFNPDYQ